MQAFVIDLSSPYLPALQSLYERAFPANERRSLQHLFSAFGDSHEMLVFVHEGRFAGFVSLLSFRDLTHILYLAIEDDLRGQGLGSEALRLIRAHKPSVRIIADLEDDVPSAANNAQRLRRMDFYRRSGYEPSEVRYEWRGEDYVIYASGGTVSEAEFEAFWEHF